MSDEIEDDIDAIRKLPAFRTFACQQCAAPVRVHALEIYAHCPRCGAQRKTRSFGGIGTEIQDVIDTVLEWAGISREEVQRRQAAKTGTITSAIPVIAVSDSARAEDYYCRVLGFQKMFGYPREASKEPRYLGLARDGVWLHLQSYKLERAGHTDAFLWVTDVDALHTEFAARGAVVQLPPTEQTWGTRELGIRDPDGNVLVFAVRPRNESESTASC